MEKACHEGDISGEENKKATIFQAEISDHIIEEIFSSIRAENGPDIFHNLKQKEDSLSGVLQDFSGHIENLRKKYYKTNEEEVCQIEQGVEEALQSLEEHYYRMCAAVSPGGDRQVVSAYAEKEACLQQINKVKEILFRAHPFLIYATAPYLTSFLYLSAKIFNKYFVGRSLLENQAIINSFFSETYEYIQNANRSLHTERKGAIQLKLQGEFSEYICIIDEATDSLLTEVVPFTKDTECELMKLLDILRQKIASSYMEHASLENLRLLVDKLSGCEDSYHCSWNFLKEFHEYDQGKALKTASEDISVSVDEDLMYGLLLPHIAQQYFPDLARNNRFLKGKEKLTKLSQHSQERAKDSAEAFKGLSFEKNSHDSIILSVFRQKLIFLIVFAFSGPLAVLSNLAIFLVNLLLSDKDPLTLEKVLKEVDKHITLALNEQEAKHLMAKMHALFLNYELRMNVLKNMTINKGKEQKDWDLGEPKDWEPLLMSFNDVTVFFNSAGRIRYRLGDLYYAYSFLYATALNYAMEAALSKGQDASYFIKLLGKHCRESYVFMTQLYDETWDYTLSYLDFRREHYTDLWEPVMEYRLYKVGDEGTEPVQRGGRAAVLEPFMVMLETTYRYFSLKNSATIDLAKAIDEMTQEYNKNFASDLPTNAELYIHRNYWPYYERIVRAMEKEEGFPVNPKRDFRKMTRSLWDIGPNSGDGQFIIEHVRNGDVVKRYDYTPGDYVLLPEILKIPKHEIRLCVYIPCMVRFYEKGDYTGKTKDIIPGDSEWSEKKKCVIISDFDIASYQSIKVRHSYKNWYPKMVYHNFARLADTDFDMAPQPVHFRDFEYYEDAYGRR